jgi:hypothetical protein
MLGAQSTDSDSDSDKAAAWFEEFEGLCSVETVAS